MLRYRHVLSIVNHICLTCILLCRMYGRPGYCSVCSETIPAFEMVMRAKSNVYHLECFACQMCNHRSVCPQYCAFCIIEYRVQLVSKLIPAFEIVMRAKSNVYHLECFACQMCNHS